MHNAITAHEGRRGKFKLRDPRKVWEKFSNIFMSVCIVEKTSLMSHDFGCSNLYLKSITGIERKPTPET
jgi:hypothetical protein